MYMYTYMYISLQTDNHASTASLNFLQAGCSSWRPTNSVKALKAIRQCQGAERLEIRKAKLENRLANYNSLLLLYSFYLVGSLQFSTENSASSGVDVLTGWQATAEKHPNQYYTTFCEPLNFQTNQAWIIWYII